MQTNGVARVLAQPFVWAAGAASRFFASIITGITPHSYYGWGLSLNRTLDYSRANPEYSSIVVACLRWVQRTFTEAPPILEQWVEEREEWAQIYRDPLLDLLERPNPYYNGSTLLKATIADRYYSGTAYWIKVRSAAGRVVELWWVPSATMEPKWDERRPDVFITHYEYRPAGRPPVEVRVEDVVQFRDGIDPVNPRKGLSPMQSLLREIFTDDEAASMTAALLRNMGVPGVLISPRQGAPAISQTAAEGLKARFIAKTTGDNRGEPFVTEHGVEIESFGFSPEQMQLRAIRGIPEERITAVLGVNAAVVGLGAGLSTTKVGATLREYREEAFESTIIPMYREFASELTHQLLSEFKSKDWRYQFDLSKVRVLQDDENKRTDRVVKELASGGILVSEFRRKLGYVALPEHDVYLRPATIVAVPAGQSPEEQGALNAPAARAALPPPTARLTAAVEAAVREVLEEAQA
jgi:HK97 family phage portal protein